MRRHKWLFTAGAMLIALSATTYALHYLVFGDYHHIFIYLVGDIAFVPLEVLLVVIVIERLLARHEQRTLIKKMNMLIIGTFFSEIGMELLGYLTEAVEGKDEIRREIAVGADWGRPQYKKVLEFVGSFDYRFDLGGMDLTALRDYLVGKREFLVLLLANPNLLEHDRFSDLLWAVFHLQEEPAARETLEGLPGSDLDHLAGDMRRVYAALTSEWLHYCRHLQSAYPYIFSIVMRTHPLQAKPSAVVA